VVGSFRWGTNNGDGIVDGSVIN